MFLFFTIALRLGKNGSFKISADELGGVGGLSRNNSTIKTAIMVPIIA